MHVIGLKHPWEKRIAGVNDCIRVDVPESESATDTKICDAIYTRFFNQPTGLDSTSKVKLRITDWTGDLQLISLNGEKLRHDSPPIEIEITKHLADRNQLEIHLAPANEHPCRLNGEVTILIVD